MFKRLSSLRFALAVAAIAALSVPASATVTRTPDLQSATDVQDAILTAVELTDVHAVQASHDERFAPHNVRLMSRIDKMSAMIDQQLELAGLAIVTDQNGSRSRTDSFGGDSMRGQSLRGGVAAPSRTELRNERRALRRYREGQIELYNALRALNVGRLDEASDSAAEAIAIFEEPLEIEVEEIETPDAPVRREVK